MYYGRRPHHELLFTPNFKVSYISDQPGGCNDTGSGFFSLKLIECYIAICRNLCPHAFNLFRCKAIHAAVVQVIHEVVCGPNA